MPVLLDLLLTFAKIGMFTFGGGYAMIPLIQDMGNMGVSNLEPIWWSLALGACLGGNGTLVGASANLIVAGLAAERGVKITFINYFKIGFPIMLLTIVLSTVYVYIRYLI